MAKKQESDDRLFKLVCALAANSSVYQNKENEAPAKLIALARRILAELSDF